MDHLHPIQARERRDEAIRRLNRLTTGAALAAVAGVGIFGVVSASTIPGSSTAQSSASTSTSSTSSSTDTATSDSSSTSQSGSSSSLQPSSGVSSADSGTGTVVSGASH